MKGICRPLRKDAILPPLLLAGVFTLLDGVLNTDDEVAVDDVALVIPLLYDPPGVFCNCCARLLLFDWKWRISWTVN